jgi:hypothetical protein
MKIQVQVDGCIKIASCIMSVTMNKVFFKIDMEKEQALRDIEKSIEENNISKLKTIIEYDSELLHEKYNPYVKTPLHYAAKYGRLEMCKFFTANGLNTNISEDNECVPLEVAANNNQLEIAKWLLENNASVDGLETTILTPMMSAVTAGHLDMVKLLVENGANVNRMHVRNGLLPLDIAMSRGYHGIIEYLKKQGAKTQFDIPDWINIKGNGILGFISLNVGKILPVDILASKEDFPVVQKLTTIEKKYNRILFTFGLFSIHNPKIELFLILPEYWNFYHKNEENQFPILLMSKLIKQVKNGLKIEEGLSIIAEEAEYCDLKWPSDIAGFSISYNYWGGVNKANDKEIDPVKLLTLIPVKKTKKGFASQSVDKNRKAGWAKLTLNLE